MTRLYGVSVLAPQRTCADIATHLRFRYVDIVRLPHQTGPTLIGALYGDNLMLSSSDAPADEWLYVVGQHTLGHEDDELTNEAFAAVLQRRLGEVKGMADRVSNVRWHALASALDADPESIPSSAQGPYYDALLTSPQLMTSPTAVVDGPPQEPSAVRRKSTKRLLGASSM